MARPLLTSSMHNLLLSSMPISTLFLAILSVLCVFSIITFLCGSDKLKNLHKEAEKATTRSSNSKEHKLISKLNSNINNRALSMVKMISWRKVREGEVEGDYSDQDEEALWRKNILMGEKCRPLNFSGKFENDSEEKS